jgi:predicted small metal-binding protein
MVRVSARLKRGRMKSYGKSVIVFLTKVYSRPVVIVLMAGYKANLKDVCGCGMEVSGKTTQEVVDKVKKHAADAHHMKEVPKEIADKLQKAIKPA